MRAEVMKVRTLATSTALFGIRPRPQRSLQLRPVMTIRYNASMMMTALTATLSAGFSTMTTAQSSQNICELVSISRSFSVHLRLMITLQSSTSCFAVCYIEVSMYLSHVRRTHRRMKTSEYDEITKMSVTQTLRQPSTCSFKFKDARYSRPF
jgi:hypothetical protein